MKNWPEFSFENLGSILSFKFVPYYAINNFPSILDNAITEEIELKAGYSWFEGLFINKGISFEEETKDSDGGDIYSYKFSGLYPGQSNEMHSLFDEMVRTPIILIVEDMNKNERIIGNTNSATKFNFSYKTKDTPSGRPEYSFIFIWNSQQQAPFYTI
jgi:hypothetical protein